MNRAVKMSLVLAVLLFCALQSSAQTFLRPTEDETVYRLGKWVDQSGIIIDTIEHPSYSSIDESGEDDSDYVSSPLAPRHRIQDHITWVLNDGVMPSDPGGPSGMWLKFRVRKSSSGGQSITNRVRVDWYQLASAGNWQFGGQVKFNSNDYVHDDDSVWTTFELPFSQDEYDRIPWEDSDPLTPQVALAIRFEPYAASGGQKRRGELSWVEVEIPTP